MFLQFELSMPATRCVSFTWSLALSSFMYASTIAEDLKDNLIHMNKAAKKKRLRPHIMRQLKESLRFYNCLRRYYVFYSWHYEWNLILNYFDLCFCSTINDFSRIFRVNVTATLMVSTLQICLGLLIVQITISQVIFYCLLNFFWKWISIMISSLKIFDFS